MVHFALATIFAIAGFTKLREPAPLRRLTAGNVSSASVARATVALSIGELILGVALVSPFAQVAAVVALAFLIVAGGLAALHRDGGRSPDCGCFGSKLQVPDRQLRAVRHAGFVVLAVLATWLPFAPSVFDVMTGVSGGVAFVLIWPLLSVPITDRRPGGGW